MTRSRYYLALVLQSFGYYRKQKRMMDSASELYLLQEGEEILGSLCWDKVENIDDISLEYWQLRKLFRRCVEIEAKISDAEKLLDKSHSERTELSNLSLNGQPELLDELADLERAKEKLIEERNNIISEATTVKRRYEGLKTKMVVLKEEGNTESQSFLDSRAQLGELKKTFGALKESRFEVAAKIEAHENELQALKNRISNKKEGALEVALETYSLIGRANRDLTKYRSELALENEEAKKLQRVIGRFLCVHQAVPSCQEAIKDQRQLVAQLTLLRESVNYNQILASRV